MFLETKEIDVDKLELDVDNPRLPSYLNRESDEIFAFLARTSSIDELVSAIGANDFFKSEPLIGVPNESGTLIIEGNRRLTALKLLSGETFEGISNRLLDAVNSANFKPKTVPVAIYETRADVLNYLGNKHIAGVKPWGALAKARYVKQLFQATDNQLSFNDQVKFVANSIGSRSDYIGRSLKALNAYDYASELNFFDLKNVDEETVKFSLLGTALDYEGIQSFVYDNPEADSQNRNIITDHLKELFSWLFEKSGDGATRLGESRNLKLLTKVVTSEEGLKKFRQGLTLDQAFTLTDGLDQEFDNISTSIQNQLRKVNSIVADVTPSTEREETTSSIFRQAKQLKSAFE